MMSKLQSHLVFASILLALLAGACAPQPPIQLPPTAGDPLSGSGDVERQVLTYAELTTPAPDLPAPVDDGAFAIPEQAAPPLHQFEGILRLRRTQEGAHSRPIVDANRIAQNWDGPITLPPFDFEFVQHGSHLIPTRQGLIYTGHHFFNLIVGPGRAWQENGDQGMTRATFPFTLVQRNQNCTFNGVMAFLFNERAVSQVRYQVTQETCPYFKIDLWGQLQAEYKPRKVSKAAEIIQQHNAEVENRQRVKPIEALAADFPNDGINLAAFLEGHVPEEVTAYGVIVDSVHYLGGCRTRYGQYAYCNQMRMASFSTAKSAFAGLALMRLGQKYGPLFYTLPVKDFVPEVKKAAGDWSDVRIYHTLDMRTGMFYTQDDENSAAMDAFLNSESFQDRLAAAINYPRSADPGLQFVYKTSDTFIGVLAMDRFYKKQEGGKADIFNLVRDDIYKPLHLSAGMMTTLRTDNRDSGVPLGGLGLFWSPDDVAKMTLFLNIDYGTIKGKPVLDPQKMDEIFHRKRGRIDPDNRNWYKNGFWIREFKQEEHPEYGCSFWVPHMSGFGGITIGMLPNRTSFYIFTDTYQDEWDSFVRELSKIYPVCPP